MRPTAQFRRISPLPWRAALLTLVWAVLGTSCQAPTGEVSMAGGQPDQSSERLHNVVIMLIDTLRADRLGVYGYERPTSPRLDQLAEEAVVFERAHSAAPWTLPSVASLMLSQPLCEHGVVYDKQTIAATSRPLAQRLKELGYRTGAYFANPYAGKLSGLDRGFDTSQLEMRQSDGARVDAWLDEAPEQEPFFLYLHNTEPHNPPGAKQRFLDELGLEVAEQDRQELAKLIKRYRQLTRVDFVRGQPLGTTDNTAEQQATMARLEQLKAVNEQLYDAQVRAADERVGSVIDALRRRGLWQDTLFVVLADHGEEMTDHGGWQHDQSVYEELIHVPLLVKLPTGSHGGLRVDQRVSLLDVLPTVMAVLGRQDLAADSRGINLLPMLEEPATTVADMTAGADMRVTSMRHNEKKFFRPWFEQRGNLNLVVVEDQWKGIYNPEVPSFELYDLAADPGEQQDLSQVHRRRARAMLQRAEEHRQACAALVGEPRSSAEIDEDQLQALKALGYVN